MSTYPTEQCRSCGQDVIWAVTTRGRDMPVDVAPARGGNVKLRDVPGQKPIAEVLSPAKQFGLQGRLRTSHLATCRQADRWRRR